MRSPAPGRSACLVAGLEDALAHAKGQPNPATREIAVEVNRTFVAAARPKPD